MTTMVTLTDELHRRILEQIDPPNRVMAPIRWYGGKGHLARQLLRLLPIGRIYVEPYCGAASLFWHKSPHPVEVLNDLNGDVINLFRVLQDPETFKEFFHRVLFTPYSRADFIRAIRYDGDDPVMRAWSFYARCNMGFGGREGRRPSDWGTTLAVKGRMARSVLGLRSRLKLLAFWHDRLTRVQLDNRDALEVIGYWDTRETVFYIDPPYIPETRDGGRAYRCEADVEHHKQLVDLLLTIKGNAMVSGYGHPLYRRLEEAGWQRYEISTSCHVAGRTRGSRLRGAGAIREREPRTEIVWVKGAIQQRLL